MCAASAGTAYCLYKYSNSSSMASSTQKCEPIDLGSQARDIPDLSAKRSNFSEELMESYDGVTTVYECCLRGAKVSGDAQCLGTQSNGSYTWITYNQVLEKAADLGSGLIHLGYDSSPETFVGIYAANKVEWILTDVACQTYSMVSVPLYDSLGSDACTYILNHAEIAVIVCDANKINIVLEKADKCPKLKHIIKIGDIEAEEKTKFEGHGITIMSFTEVEELGRKNPQEKKPPKPDDVYTICFTSGTTGQPKGVMLTNRNLVASITGLLTHFDKHGFSIDANDVHISYLPLPHMYERLAQATLRCVGASSGFYRGDVKLLLEDLQLLRPTFFPSVPRLLSRIYDKVTASVESAGGLKKWLFEKAYASKEANVLKGQVYNNGFWDKLVFRKVQALLGGRVRLITTGAAPIESKVLRFLKVVFGCFIVEGYGLTESSSLISCTYLHDNSSGNVGPPVVCCIVKLVDVPEMEYHSSNNQGELCAKGPCIFKGYLKAPDKTAEVLEDGWLHTGDIGEWTKEGTLKIIGRKKCIFKLSQGEYIAPDKVENIYNKSPFVAQSFVHGYSIKSCVVAIVIPDEEILMKWAKENDVKGTFNELCQMQEVEEMIFKDIIAKGKEANLASFEQVKRIHLHSELFSVENNLLTPTFKSKRFVIQKTFSDEIERMYEKLEEIEHPEPKA